MTTGAPDIPDITKTEYQAGLDQHRLMSNLRRQDMAFVTTIQAAIFTIVGPKLLQLGISDFILSVLAFFVLLLGLNSERRLVSYMNAYMKRVAEIEASYGMSMFSGAGDKTLKKRAIISNAKVFQIYYLVFVVAWLLVWISNLWKKW